MQILVPALAGGLLIACAPVPDNDSVESLIADHERLAVLRSRCKLEHERLGDALCARVAEATRRHFMQRRPAASEQASQS